LEQDGALVEDLVDRLLRRDLAASGHFHVIEAPFNADPRALAYALARSVRDRLWPDAARRSHAPQQEYHAGLVVLPIRLTLLESSGATTGPHDLPGRLARAIQEEADLAHAPDVNALAIALRYPGKLILLTYDDPSIPLWDRMLHHEAEAACVRLMRELR